MTREEAIQWLKAINTKEFGWDEFALQESQREIRERCEKGVREAIDMAIEALSADAVSLTGTMKYLTKPHNYCEVVRCKDCRHRDLFSCPLADNDFQKDEDFCSWGERREQWT